MSHFKARWGKPLIVSSVLATALCLGVAFAVPLLPQPRHGAIPIEWIRWLAGSLIAGTALFTVRGYTITPDAILIHRLVWNTRLSLDGLRSVEFAPGAMRKSLRTCGNGGFFSFTGWYWSKSLGAYRVFVTDLNRTVILRYEKRTVILSPHEPEIFVHEVRNRT